MNRKVILFTFRTFPEDLLESLETTKDQIFIFGKLKEDIERFKEVLKHSDTDHAIGFALSGKSRQETTALNKFNNGSIDVSAPVSRVLKVLDKSPFKEASKPTHSFCNYAMFTLSEFIETSFFHIKNEDFRKFVTYYKNLV